MDTLKRNLKVLGFSEEEVIIYLATLEEGYTTPLSLARTTGIPRTTVYLLIEALAEKNILSVVEKGSKKSYVPISPEHLIRLAQQKKTELQETVVSLRNELPQLQALFEHSQHKPHVSYFSGVDEVTKILKTHISRDTIYICRSISSVPREFSLDFDTFINYWEQEMIPIKESILGLNERVSSYVKKFESGRHQIITVDTSLDSNVIMVTSGDVIIYLLDYSEQVVAIAIKDSALAQFEIARFSINLNAGAQV